MVCVNRKIIFLSLISDIDFKSELKHNIIMKSKVTFEELKAVKSKFPNYLVSVALETVNAAFEAVSDTFEVSKEDFLKVVASDYGVVYFMGKAYLAAREEEKSEISTHAFYLFDELLSK